MSRPLVPTGNAPSVNRARRVSLGVLASGAGQLVGIVGQLLLVPLFLEAWGIALYGEWLTLTAAIGYLAALDLGLQTYVINRMNATYARGELDNYTRILHSALHWSLLLVLVAVPLVVLTLVYTPLFEVLDFSRTSHNTVVWVGGLLALHMAISIPQGLISGIYRSIGEFPRGAFIAAFQRTLHLAVTAAALVCGLSLVHVAALWLLPVVGVTAWVLSDLKERHPNIQVGLAQRDLRLALSFLAPSGMFFLLQLALLLSLQGSVMLTGALFGAATVAVFVSLRTLANLARQLMSLVTHALWPELTALEARGEYAVMASIHLFAIKATSLLGFVAAILLHFVGGDLVAMWTGGRLTFDSDLMSAFALLVALQTPWMTSMYFLLATNRHAKVSLLMLAASVSGLLLAWPLGRAFGPAGLVYGMGLSELVICGLSVPKMTCTLLERPFSQYMTQVIARGAAVGGLSFGLIWVGVRLLGDASPVPRTLALSCAASLIAVGCGYSLWLDPEERHSISRYFGRT